MTEKQDHIIFKLNEIAEIASEIMSEAVTGEDGNLYEMCYHIRCYVNKIIKHLQKEWKNNIKFVERKNKRKEEKIKEQVKQEDEVQQLMEKISWMFRK
jgi:hypothetical protein